MIRAVKSLPKGRYTYVYKLHWLLSLECNSNPLNARRRELLRWKKTSHILIFSSSLAGITRDDSLLYTCATGEVCWESACSTCNYVTVPPIGTLALKIRSTSQNNNVVGDAQKLSRNILVSSFSTSSNMASFGSAIVLLSEINKCWVKEIFN